MMHQSAKGHKFLRSRKVVAIAILFLSLCVQQTLAWTPSERYCRFIRTFRVDRAWVFTSPSKTNTSKDGHGNVDSGAMLAEYPGVIAWSCMIWNEKTNSTDDHALKELTVWLYNKSTGEELRLAYIKFDADDDDDTKFDYLVDYSQDTTYAVTRRYYDDYIDGSVFAYFNTYYSEEVRNFIERAGSNLQIHGKALWDDNKWNWFDDKSDAKLEDFVFSSPEKPRLIDVQYANRNGQTGILFTVPDDLAGMHLTVELLKVRDEQNGRYDVVSTLNLGTHCGTFFIPFSSITPEEVAGRTYAVRVLHSQSYSYSQSNYNAKTRYRTDVSSSNKERNLPSPTTTRTRESDFFYPSVAQLPEGNFQAVNKEDGTIEVSWTVPARQTGISYDDSEWLLEVSSKSDFSDIDQSITIPYSASSKRYNRIINVAERNQGERPYYFRLSRTSMQPGLPDITARTVVNTNYKQVSQLEVRSEIDDSGNLTSNIIVSWVLSDGLWPASARAVLEYGTSQSVYKKNETTAIVRSIPACTPITFTLSVVDNDIPQNSESYSNFVLPNTAPSRLSKYSASKGFYNDRTIVKWTVDQDAQNFHHFVVKRKEYNAPNSQFTPLTTINYTPGELQYNYTDRDGVVGVYYEYALDGYTLCDDSANVVLTEVEVGFSQPYGLVTGQITYSGNQGVEGVTVCAQGDGTRSNHTLQLAQTDTVRFPAELVGAQGTVEMLLRPDSSFVGNHTILSRQGGMSFSVADTLFSSGRFSHVAWAWSDGRYTLFLDGHPQVVNAQSLFNDGTLSDELILTGISGWVDEIRFWNVAHDSARIADTRSRYLSGNEQGLVGYYRCDDPIPGKLYDISRTGTEYNEHHAETKGTMLDAYHVPTVDQLALKAITDANGNYLINAIPYTADGCLYNIIPLMGVHEFAPSSKPIFFNASTNTHNNVDFTDKSSFKVRGAVYYDNTTIPVEGVSFKIDGTNVCTRDGKMITTDKNGEYEIEVPIGSHFITAELLNHTFTYEGRYPSTAGQTKLFDRSMENLNFYDNTTVLLVGRVVGGAVEAVKPNAMGTSKNNIGVTEITLAMPNKQQALNKQETNRQWQTPDTLNCHSTAYTQPFSTPRAHEVVIRTDSATGEFAVALPPVNFLVDKLRILSDSDYVFDSQYFCQIKLSDKPGIFQRDSVVYDGGRTVVNYNASYSAIRTNQPTLTIRQGYDDGLGERDMLIKAGTHDTLLVFYEKNADTIRYNYGCPIFRQQTYVWHISVGDFYVNHDGPRPVVDSVVWAGGNLSIVNEMDAEGAANLTLDSNGEAYYVWTAGEPMLTAPYTQGLQITMSDTITRRSVEWEKNQTFRGILLGGKMEKGNDYVTLGPNSIDYILRCPPGKGSTATWKSGSSVYSQHNTTWHWNGAEEFLTRTGFGMKNNWASGTALFQVIQDIHAKAFLNVGLNAKHDYTTTNVSQIKTGTTQDLTLDRSAGLVGSDGDVFYGKSSNRLFGVCQNLAFRLDTLQNTVTLGVAKAITMGDSITTTFQYSQYDIIHTQIPNLKLLRSQYEVKHVDAQQYNKNYPNAGDEYIYITTLAANDPARYETGNYLAIAPTKKNVTTFDSLSLYNGAIEGWIDAMRQNEAAKVMAISSGTVAFNKGSLDDAEKRFGCYSYFHLVFADSVNTNTHTLTEQENKEYGNLLGRFLQDDENDPQKRLLTRDGFELWKISQGLRDKKHDDINSKSFYRGGWFVENRSVSGGETVSSAYTEERTKGEFKQYDYTLQGVIGSEEGLQINEHGVVFSQKITQGGGDGYINQDTQTSTSTVGYTLGANRHETYTVDIYRAPDGYGPIFYVRGGETYCPYEKPEKTQFMPQEFTISEGTIQLEQPQITAGAMHAYRVTDVPAGEPVPVKVKLANIANIENQAATMSFNLAVVPNTNPYGLDVRLNGRSLGADDQNILLRCPEWIEQTLTLVQTDLSVNEYDSVALVFRSACQPLRIADTLWLSVHYVPECTPLQLSAEGLTLSTSTSETLQLTLSGYDRNYYGLTGLRLERRAMGDTRWTVDSVLDIIKVTSSTAHYQMRFPSDTWPDGQYEVRAVSVCAQAENESNVLLVTKDMQKPTLLGNPEPSNGLYTLENELAINWTEPIQEALLNKARHFSIRGQLNAALVDHSVALDLAQPSRTEAQYVISAGSFGAEMWLRSRSAGDIIRFGGDKCIAALDAQGHLLVTLDGATYTSQATVPTDKWVYLYININQDDQPLLSASAFTDAQTIALFSAQPVSTFSCNGNLSVGGNMQGEMHSLKLWSTARSETKAQDEMHSSPDLYTPGLSGYWPMDEGYGFIAADDQRARNLTLPANAWYLDGVNYALQVTDSADLDITRTNLLPTDEYVLEFWFASTEQRVMAVCTDTAQLLLSQGDNYIMLSSPYTGQTYSEAVPGHRADGQWHHCALSYVRNGYATIFLDGKAVLMVPQTAINGMRGGSIRFFSGAIDELRLWRGRVDATLIAGRRYTRLQNDEPGLAWRLPFEQDSIDSGNQHQMMFSQLEMVHHDSLAFFGPAQLQAASTCPPLRQAKIEEDVMFDFTSSATRTVFSLTSDVNRLEGATLTCTARLVPDVAGNLSDAVSWQVVVNQSQLEWKNSNFVYSTEPNTSDDIPLWIVNNSGLSDTWEISGLPDWLTLPTTRGSINGMSDLILSAAIDEGLSPGYYSACLTLTGKQGIRKQMDIVLHVQAAKPDWSVTTEHYSQTMNIIGQVVLPSGYAVSKDHLLAAFSGQDCVGLAHPQYFSAYGTYFVMMTVYGNPGSTQQLTFRLWDSTTGRIFSPLQIRHGGLVYPNLPFCEGAVLGGLMEPIVFVAGLQIEQTVTFSPGWNWRSFFVEPESSEMSSVLAPVIPDMVQVKSPTAFSIPAGDSLVGSLRHMEPELMYKTNMISYSELRLEGTLVDPSLHPITIHSGWNWIGFISSGALPIKNALSNFSPVMGDFIKSSYGFSVWDGADWVGTVRSMVPGEGYMYYSESFEDRTLVYPSANIWRVAAAPALVAEAEHHYSTNVSGFYPTTMSIVLQVQKNTLPVSGYQVGAFVDEECRGVSYEQDGLLFISMEGVTGETVSFRLWDTAEQQEYTASETITYQADALVGNTYQPFVINLGEAPFTSLTDTPEDTDVKKVIINNEVFIIRNGRFYDVLGRERIVE